ncbi:type I restriction endonuclease [Marinomonas sp. TI.3.20]|uniref:type I restriction endonuclease n=1 Tax=Marinomonas sp. TI.3.20 TaxID=3121296 RepID=UPI00311DD522
MKFNEDSRVKIPAILHLMRLGYQYLSLKGQAWDLDTNIFPDLFKAAISKINPGIEATEAGRLLEDVKLLLDNEDLGRAFFERLSERSNTKLIDFENFNNNSFHVVTELTCQNGDEEFRPDITLLINGMPLVFIEVKKPNNREGVLAERDRINAELEAMAKTLYDYWFVQFDFPDDSPRGQGNPYKTSGGKMVYNPILKREIPEGWEVKKLSEIAVTGSGGTPLSSTPEFYENGTIPWINSGELNAQFIVSTANFITELGLEKSSAKLFSKNTILMAMYGATAGKVSFIDFPAATNQAICAINPFDQEMNVYLKFTLERLYEYLINLSSGSARDNLSQDKIKSLDVVIPAQSTLTQFHEFTKSKMDLILTNLKENQELASLRDWLLPMLMNGQVTVVEAS